MCVYISNVSESNRRARRMNKPVVIALLSLGVMAFCEGKEFSELLEDEKFVEDIKNCILEKESCDEMGFKVRSKICLHLYIIFCMSVYSASGIMHYISL